MKTKVNTIHNMLLTVYVLYPLDVVLMQGEVVGVNPLVERSHDGAGIV